MRKLLLSILEKLLMLANICMLQIHPLFTEILNLRIFCLILMVKFFSVTMAFQLHFKEKKMLMMAFKCSSSTVLSESELKFMAVSSRVGSPAVDTSAPMTTCSCSTWPRRRTGSSCPSISFVTPTSRPGTETLRTSSNTGRLAPATSDHQPML